MKLEGHMHNTKSSSFFAINHDDNHKFSFKFARATECKYACDRVFANEWIMRSPKLRLTGVLNLFHDFQIEILEGNLYNNYFLTSDHLFIFFLYVLISTFEF